MDKQKNFNYIRKSKGDNRFNIVILICFFFLLIWTLSGIGEKFWPFGTILLSDDSLLLKNMGYNNGTDFVSFYDSLANSDGHNYFVVTVIPKIYSDNGITVSVNKNGSINIKGINSGSELRIELNEKASKYPAGEYFFNLNMQAPEQEKVKIQWARENPDGSEDHIQMQSDQYGVIACDGVSQLRCEIVIAAGSDFEGGVNFCPYMEYLTSASDAENYDLSVISNDNYYASYLRVIHPGASGRYGKVFSIKRDDFYALSDREKKVFQKNLSYLFKSGYYYVSILFEDGTGIEFLNSDIEEGIEGTMDSAGILIVGNDT